MPDLHRHGGPRAVFFVFLALAALLTGCLIGLRLSDAPTSAAAYTGPRAVRFAETVTPRPSAYAGRNFFAAAGTSATNTDSTLNQTSAGTVAPRTAMATTPAATATLSAAARTAIAGNANAGVAAVAPTPASVRTVTAATTPAATATPRPGTAATVATVAPTAAVPLTVAPTAMPTPAPTTVPVSSLSPTAAPITDAATIYAKVNPAVVTISNPAQRQPRSHTAGIASGVVYDAQGYIVTVGRVVAGARPGELVKQVDVVFANDRKVTGTVIGRDLTTDLAVVKIEPAAVPGVAPLGDSSGVRVGQAVIAIGNPMEFTASVTRGVISGVNRPVGERSGLIQTSAATSSGNHGGPLIDGNGNVIGILTLNIHDDATIRLGFAVPGTSAKSVTAALVQAGAVVRPSLGATTEMLTPPRAVALGLAVNSGAYVSTVAKDGPADKGGLLPGDVIVAANGTAVTNAAPLTDTMRALTPRQNVMLTVNRKGAMRQVAVVLGESAQ